MEQSTLIFDSCENYLSWRLQTKECGQQMCHAQWHTCFTLSTEDVHFFTKCLHIFWRDNFCPSRLSEREKTHPLLCCFLMPMIVLSHLEATSLKWSLVTHTHTHTHCLIGFHAAVYPIYILCVRSHPLCVSFIHGGLNPINSVIKPCGKMAISVNSQCL